MTLPAPPEGASAADRAGRSRPAPAMDEQATPGLFSGSGGGSLRAPQAPAEAARAHYHVPGILHFLRHEWARFEVERAQWEVERAELQVGAHTASIIGQPGVSGGGECQHRRGSAHIWTAHIWTAHIRLRSRLFSRGVFAWRAEMTHFPLEASLLVDKRLISGFL